MEPLVSVIIPAFNAEPFIRECLDSILTQTYRNLEVIVIDDASTDTTAACVQSYSDKRISLLRNTRNSGLAASVNAAIRKSNGEFIARMDADDIAVASRIERQIRFLQLNPQVDIVGTAMQSFGGSRFLHIFPTGHEHCKCRLLFNVCFGHPTVVFRRAVFDSANSFYREELEQYSEEYDLWCTLVDRFHFANLPEPLVHYRVIPSQAKSVASQKRRTNSFHIRNHFMEKNWGHVSEDEKEAHDHICNRDQAPRVEVFEKWLAWLDQMKIMNTKAPAFDTKMLADELDWRTFELFYANTQLGLANWQKWFDSQSAFRPSLKRKLFFFGKSFLKQ